MTDELLGAFPWEESGRNNISERNKKGTIKREGVSRRGNPEFHREGFKPARECFFRKNAEIM